jgi:hypothetical protein
MKGITETKTPNIDIDEKEFKEFLKDHPSIK